MRNVFEGIVKRFYRREETTGFSSFGVETDEIDVVRNADGLVICEGVVPKWPLEISLIMTGSWDGSVFVVATAKPVAETEDASKRLLKQIVKELKEEDEDFKLSSAGIKKILSITGKDIFLFMKKSDALNTLISGAPKIDEEKLKKIYERLLEANETSSVLDYIMPFGGTIINCERLLKVHGPSAIRRLKRNPYKVGYLCGMDFFTCDRIAMSLKRDALGKDRLESLIFTALDQAMDKDGSTYVTQSNLKKSIQKINRKSAYADENIPDAIVAATINNMHKIVVELVTNGARIYKRYYYNMEKNIAYNLKRLNHHEANACYSEKYIADAEKYLGIKYSEKQKEAFNLLKTSGVKIITGGPGTGKTTIINGILYIYKKMFPSKKINLCAPTGRAAQRISEITSMESLTIHRTLEFKPFGDNMMHKDTEDPIDGDMIVVDEMSMVDTEIFSMLLPAIKSGALVILIGDEDQLQSVSSGNILHDLIESKQFETYRLKEVFRQKDGNTIIENAYKILNGDINFTKDETFEIYACESNDDANVLLNKIYDDICINHDEDKTLILSPVKIGTCGTNAINQTISAKTHKNEEKDSYFSYSKMHYHIGERVIFGRNNYSKGYYNGDLGYITEIRKNGFTVKVGTDLIVVEGESLKDVSLAYAITIHKAQGSENDIIVIVLTDDYMNMLNRNLLFTAVTRAKKQVKIIYVNSALYNSVNVVRVDKRITGLTDKILGVKREVLM